MGNNKLDEPKETTFYGEIEPEIKFSSSNEVCLIAISGNMMGQKFILPKDEVIIGRERSDIIIEDNKVSRRHAKIKFLNGTLEITDLNSTNGTYVNYIPVKSSQILRYGDRIIIGGTAIKVLHKDDIEVRYHEDLFRLSTTDGLTQIFNKRYFIEQAKIELEKGKRYKKALSLVLFDIDHFKKFNDTYGHSAGDFILQNVCRVISKRVRTGDIFARYGGEEFAIILIEADNVVARNYAESIRELIESSSFKYGNPPRELKVTISLGVSTFIPEKREYKDIESMIEVADRYLYQAKWSGRNRVCSS